MIAFTYTVDDHGARVDNEDYVNRFFGDNQDDKTPERTVLRECLRSVFAEKDDIKRVQVAGDLIEYMRDVLSALAGTRRCAAAHAKETMTTEQIAQLSGLSRVAVSRMVTEYRNYS